MEAQHTPLMHSITLIECQLHHLPVLVKLQQTTVAMEDLLSFFLIDFEHRRCLGAEHLGMVAGHEARHKDGPALQERLRR